LNPQCFASTHAIAIKPDTVYAKCISWLLIYAVTALAEGAASNWLKLVDSGNYAQSWDDTGNVLKANVARDQWQEVLLRNRAPLGALISRKLRSVEYTTKLPGAPDGQYVVLEYESSFEHKNSAIETVTPMMDKDGKWRVCLYIVK
jgi:hypothetical protein